MKKKLLLDAFRTAVKHMPNHPSYMDTWMHWAFIVHEGSIVEWGTNLRGTPPTHYGYNKKIVDVDAPCKLHAEVVAYRRAKKLLGKSLTSFDIINVRLDKRGNPKISAPCCCCKPLLHDLGCVHFYYTTECGWGKII